MTEKIKFSDGTQLTREEIRDIVKKQKLTLDDLEELMNMGFQNTIKKGSEGYKVYKEEIIKYQSEKKRKSKPPKRKLRRPLHPKKIK